MKDRRRPAHEITPQIEDGGIFRRPPTNLVVELVPKFGMNAREDVMIKGFVGSNVPIDVVFPGRRKAYLEPLVQKLRTLWTVANRRTGKTDRPPEVDEVRLAVRIEGSWRPRFQRDDQGWQTRTHQLFAARWMVAEGAGEVKTCGEAPIRSLVTEAPKHPTPTNHTRRSSTGA